MFEFFKIQYELRGESFLPKLQKAVKKGILTEAEYKEITGKDYVAPDA